MTNGISRSSSPASFLVPCPHSSFLTPHSSLSALRGFRSLFQRRNSQGTPGGCRLRVPSRQHTCSTEAEKKLRV